MRFTILAGVILLTLGGHVAGALPAARPNIILILADDLGYSDLGCYGGEIRTPHLDALASGGLRFRQFYNCGRCCPTRASLLTGLYPHQAGVGRMTNDANLPGYRGRLTENTVTIAEVLRAAGYRTAMAGKWHLSNTRQGPDHLKHLNNQTILDTFSDPKTYPVARGFERFYGTIWGVVNYFDPFSLVNGGKAVREVPADYYITDAITDHAVGYIEEFAKGSEPFFLYVAHVAPHWPLHVRDAEAVKRYAQTYFVGWDAIQARRLKKMEELGVHSGREFAPRHEPAVNWGDNLEPREWHERSMAVHAAMVERMDHGVGRIVAKLRETNRLDDTLILFLSDNGASPEVMKEPGFDRPSETRNGRRIAYTHGSGPPPGGQESFAAIGPFWASVANTPWRFWKAEMYDGGIRTPMIVHWPAGIKSSSAGTLILSEAGHVMDIMPTCVELAGARYPKEFQGRAITPVEGRSFAPLLRGEPELPARVLAWEHIGARAIRDGSWKLVCRRDGPWALYNLGQDQGEQNDLSAREPEQVRKMEAQWQQWAKRTQVFPTPKSPQ